MNINISLSEVVVKILTAILLSDFVDHMRMDIDQNVKVQMKCFFLFPNLKEQQKSGRLPFTVS